MRAMMTDQARVLDEAVRKASVTRSVFVGCSALAALPESARSIQGRSFLLVADTHTMDAAGRQAGSVLEGAGFALAEPIILPGEPRVKPHAETAREIGSLIRDRGAVPISIGSGVINDLTKYA